MLSECMPKGYVFPGHDLNSQELRNNHAHLCDVICPQKPLTHMISCEASPQLLKQAGEVSLLTSVLPVRKVMLRDVERLPQGFK